MSNKRGIIAFLAGLVFSTQAVQAAPEYIELQSLTDIVNVPIAPVGSGSVQVPLITWGADIITVYANGNRSATTSQSIFSQNNLDLRLVLQNDFAEQLKMYLQGESPYLRGTMGMINMAIELLSQNSETVPVVIYQLSWSTGGDALVVKENIETLSDLKGKTIAVQAYGPHVDYLIWILNRENLSFSDIKVKWLRDLTGTPNSPIEAFRESDVDAALMIVTDALIINLRRNCWNRR